MYTLFSERCRHGQCQPSVAVRSCRNQRGAAALRYRRRLDWKLFRSCFADEIEVDFTSVFGDSEPRKISSDLWAEAARRTVSGFKTTQHMITNHVITVNGDKALCVAYNEQGDSTQTIRGYSRTTSSARRMTANQIVQADDDLE
jgi:hypothetical protein